MNGEAICYVLPVPVVVFLPRKGSKACPQPRQALREVKGGRHTLLAVQSRDFCGCQRFFLCPASPAWVVKVISAGPVGLLVLLLTQGLHFVAATRRFREGKTANNPSILLPLCSPSFGSLTPLPAPPPLPPTPSYHNKISLTHSLTPSPSHTQTHRLRRPRSRPRDIRAGEITSYQPSGLPPRYLRGGRPDRQCHDVRQVAAKRRWGIVRAGVGGVEIRGVWVGEHAV